MKKIAPNIKLIVLAHLFFAIDLYGQPLLNSSDKIDNLFAQWNKSNSPGVAVCVLKDNQVLYKKTFGTANLEYNQSITSKTIFNIGSVSKQFTIMAIYMLEKEGLLSLDEDVSTIVNNFPYFNNTITIRHLIHHTSGIRDWVAGMEIAGWRLDDNFEMRDILQFIENQRNLNFPPGEDFLYSNSGYSLLAEIVRKKTNEPFSKWMKENIFEPLGMYATVIPIHYGTVIPNRATGYESNQFGFNKYSHSSSTYGSSGIYSSLDDMIKWVQYLNNPSGIQLEIIEKMNTVGFLNNGSEINYAGGQFTGKHRGISYLYHAGNSGAYVSYISRYSKPNLSIILLSNAYDFLPPSRTGKKIAELLLPASVDSINPSQTFGATPTINSELLSQLKGTYEFEDGNVLSLSSRNDKIYVRKSFQAPLKVVLDKKMHLINNLKGIRIDFIKTKTKVTGLNYKFNGRSEQLMKIEFFSGDAKALKPLTGTYFSEELNTTYKVTESNGSLYLTHHINGTSLLLQKTSHFFTSNNYLGIKFNIDENHSATEFMLNSSRVNNILFTKTDED